MSGDGWVKLHRQILENLFLMHDDTAFIVFVKLLLMVNRDGEYASGRRKLAKYFGISDTTLYSALLRLQTNGMLVLSTNQRYTIIRVKNWKTYQGSKIPVNHTLAEKPENTQFYQPLDQPLHQPPNNIGEIEERQPPRQPPRQPTVNHSSTTRQHYNKNKKENKNLEIGTNVPMAKTPSADIDLAFSFWEEKTGNAIVSNRQRNRYACSNLLKRYGAEGLQQLIDGVALAQADRYAPRISDFAGLQSKLNELLVWGRSHKQAKGKVYKV